MGASTHPTLSTAPRTRHKCPAYARFTGRRDQSAQWAERARGWLRVLRWDACVVADALRVLKFGAATEAARLRWVKTFCVLFPVIALLFFVFIEKPGQLVLASGVMQAIMLPMLGAAALYFRYRRCDPRIVPGRLWDLMLWTSAMGLLLAGGWLALTKLFPALEQLGQ